MIVEEEFLGKLRRAFNLNLYEVKLWTALLSRGVSTAGELSDMANVPRSRTYDVLESLERKGFVVIQPDKPIKYIAISPRDVLDRVNKRVTNEAARQSEKLTQLRDSEVITELHQLYEQGIEPMSPTDFSGTLKGRHNIYDHLSMLIKEAEKSVEIVTSDDGFIRKVRALRPVMEKAKERGVIIRIAAPISEANYEFVGKISDLAEVRNLCSFDSRFCIIDRRQIVFMLLNDKDTHPTYDLAMWISSPYFSTAIGSLFDRLWEKEAASAANIKPVAKPVQYTEEPQDNYIESEKDFQEIGDDNVNA